MVYTRDWTTVVEATPLGTADPGTIDDRIREKMVDVRERMNDVVADFTADPVVPKPQKRTGVKLYVTAMGGNPENDEDDVVWTGSYIQSDNTLPNAIFFNIPVLNIWKITGIKVIVDKNTATSMTLEIHRQTFSVTPADAVLASQVVSTTGIQNVQLYGPAGADLTDGQTYYLKAFSADNKYRVYMIEVTYDEV